MASKVKAPEYITLDGNALIAVDVYLASREKRKTHDSKARNLKKQQDEALKHVLEAMGDADLAQLPDGRMVYRNVIERKIKAQKAREYSYTELDVKDPAA